MNERDLNQMLPAAAGPGCGLALAAAGGMMVLVIGLLVTVVWRGAVADPRQLHRRAGEMASDVIGCVRPDQFAHATPCTEWDVRALIDHVVGGNLGFAAMVAGEPRPDGGDDVAGGDLLASFQDSLSRLYEAFDRPGFLEQAFPTPLGEGPGALLVGMRVVELTIHTWDVAAALGRPRDLDPELVGFAGSVLRSMPIPRGVGGPFAPERPSPPGAADADRLAAFAGRIVPAPGHQVET